MFSSSVELIGKTSARENTLDFPPSNTAFVCDLLGSHGHMTECLMLKQMACEGF